MAPLILAVVVAVLVTVGYIKLYNLYTNARTAYEEVDKSYADLADRMDDCIAERLRAEAELKYIKETLAVLATRELAVAITDQQINQISQTMLANMTPIERMN